MNTWRLVKLDFGNNPAHFGELGIGMEKSSERVRSDTLFSAWAIAYARLFGTEALKQLLGSFPSAPKPPTDPVPPTDPKLPFRLSSTFIYQQKNGEDVYYLPRPQKRPINYPSDDLSIAKTYKKIEFLPLDIWKKWYQDDTGFSESDLDKLRNHKGEEYYEKAFRIETHPKISVDRLTSAANLYHTGFVRYRSDNEPSGLYFLIYFPESDRSLEDKLKASLYLLGDEGIGGERSSGAGRFIPTWDDLPKKYWHDLISFKGNYYSLISLYWDEKLDEGFLDDASYELQERGGWIASPFSGRQLRRKSVKMFTEGSIFIKNPQGKLADVTPRDADGNRLSDHCIYRSGISLSIPIKASEE